MQEGHHVDGVHFAGGLAVLLIEFRRGGMPRRYAIKWADVPWQILRTAESVAEADLSQSRIQVGTCYLESFVKPNPLLAQKIRAKMPTRVFPRE